MDIQDRIDKYWSKRADEFSDARLADLKNDQKGRWLDIIRENMPEKINMKVLDIGTGTGFFTFILQDLGCMAVGIDYSEQMIENARDDAKKLGYDNVEFLRMDAQNLEFEDNTFDFVISRNVTWTLPDPKKAYKEMIRVLKNGGRILNFDANYGMAFIDADKKGLTQQQASSENRDIYSYPSKSMEMLQERNKLAKELYICNLMRPQWDVDVLISNGMHKVTVDVTVGKTMYKGCNDINGEEKTPPLYSEGLFMVCAEK